MPNGNGEVRATYDFGALEQRVRNVEGTISNVRSDIAGLSSKIDAQQISFASASKTNWSVLASFFGAIIVVIGALGGIAKSPIDAALIRLDADVREVNRQIVPRAEADSRIAVINRDIRDLVEQSKTFASKAEIETSGKRRDDIQRLNEGRLDRLMAQLEEFRASIVPRGEHSRWWASQETADANLQRQIDELKKSFGDTFSLRDALIQMQRRIDALEGQRAQPPRS